MKLIVLAAVVFLAFGTPVQAQTTEGAEGDKAEWWLEDTVATEGLVILSIQTHLQDLGYDPGPADGTLSPRTIEAIRAFETNEGLHHTKLEGITRLAGLSNLMLAAVARASFDEGWAAYERGDYETALKEWRPLAEQGTFLVTRTP